MNQAPMKVRQRLAPATRVLYEPGRGSVVSQKRADVVDRRDRTSPSTPPPVAASRSAPSRRLLARDQVPAWYQTDYILTGYRPVAHSVRRCLESLGFCHNETVNIYSHLVPAVAALLGNWLLARHFALRFPLAPPADRAVFHLYLATSVLCFGVSSTFHTLLCHSPSYFALWLRLDYVAIIVQILGSFISGLYIGFYCEPHLQNTYWSMITSLGVLAAFLHLHPGLGDKKWRALRLAVLVATGLSAFVPIVHAVTLFPYAQLESQAGLRYYYLEGALMLVGAGFYASRFPESWKPARFDIWGSSHQIFHCLVVLGAVAHFRGLLTAYEWNYTNQRCLFPK